VAPDALASLVILPPAGGFNEGTVVLTVTASNLDTDGTETETLSTSSSLTVTIRPGSTPIRGPDSPLGWLKQHVPSVVSDLQGSQHGNDFMQLIDRVENSANIAASEVQNSDPQGSAVSQFVHEQLGAPDHGGIGAQVSALAQAQHGPNQNGDPQDSAVSQFVHELLAAPDHSGIGAQVSAFAQAQHTPNQTGELEASLEMGGRFSENITLDPGAHATLKIDHAADVRGTVAGFGSNDVLDLADLAFGKNTTLGYAANTSNTGGSPRIGAGQPHVGCPQFTRGPARLQFAKLRRSGRERQTNKFNT